MYTWESEAMYFSDMNCLIHVIQEGDTLYSLSRRYNVPLSALFRANPYVEIYNLQIGDELCVPVAQQVPPMNFENYVIENGDTIESVLDRFGITLDELMEFNDMGETLNNQPLQPGIILQIPVYQ